MEWNDIGLDVPGTLEPQWNGTKMDGKWNLSQKSSKVQVSTFSLFCSASTLERRPTPQYSHIIRLAEYKHKTKDIYFS